MNVCVIILKYILRKNCLIKKMHTIFYLFIFVKNVYNNLFFLKIWDNFFLNMYIN